MKKFGTEKYLSNLSIDCVIFGYEANEIKVLLSKFKFGQGTWTLPGGYVMWEESIEQAATRTLKERTGLQNIYLEQFRVFGAADRIIGSEIRNTLKEELSEKYNPADAEWITGRFV
ncbi:MAG: NUDIX domain-containing protein, partial [Leadbetterella sp.]|nr:NUDIX domain-containing protein [Leadbetterella sp.]